jgi:hypothetical protein
MSSPARSLFSPSQRPNARSWIPANVNRLAAHLQRDAPGDLLLVSAQTIESAMAALQLSPPARAEVDIWLQANRRVQTPDDTPNNTLADAVERQRLARLFPWLAEEEAALRQNARFARDWQEDKEAALTALRNDFEAKAKNNTLGTLESLVGQYCLYCEDPAYGCYLLMSLLLRLPATARIPVHNWLIANDMPRGAKEAYGVAISSLQVPLFPVVPGLTAANAKLLETTPTGAGFLQIGQVDGAWVANAAPLEQQLDALQQQQQLRYPPGQQRWPGSPGAPRPAAAVQTTPTAATTRRRPTNRARSDLRRSLRASSSCGQQRSQARSFPGRPSRGTTPAERRVFSGSGIAKTS